MDLTMLDVAIGLAFVYLLVSLMCSAVLEIVEAWFQKRSSDLIRGIYEMLKDPNDPDGSLVWLREFYRHPLVNSLHTRGMAFRLTPSGSTASAGGEQAPGHFTAQTLKEPPKNLPDYIPARIFVLTLIDLVKNPPSVNGTPLAVPESVQRAVRPLMTAVGTDLDQAAGQVQEWYDSTMDRVSGEFKRNRQKWLLVLGVFVAFAFNIDTFAITKGLSTSPELRQSMVQAAQKQLQRGVDQAAASTPTDPSQAILAHIGKLEQSKLPIGWGRSDKRTGWDYLGGWGWLLKPVGWVMTGLAVSLGAPFWFDLLNKFMIVRSTVKPKEKSPEEKPVS